MVTSRIYPLNALLAAGAVASFANGFVKASHPDGSIRVCANGENGALMQQWRLLAQALFP